MKMLPHTKRCEVTILACGGLTLSPTQYAASTTATLDPKAQQAPQASPPIDSSAMENPSPLRSYTIASTLWLIVLGTPVLLWGLWLPLQLAALVCLLYLVWRALSWVGLLILFFADRE